MTAGTGRVPSPNWRWRAGLLLDTDRTFIVDHGCKGSVDRVELIPDAAEALNLDMTRSWVVGDRPPDVGLAASTSAYGIYLGDRTPEESGVWCLPELATAFSFISERITNDCN